MDTKILITNKIAHLEAMPFDAVEVLELGMTYIVMVAMVMELKYA